MWLDQVLVIQKYVIGKQSNGVARVNNNVCQEQLGKTENTNFWADITNVWAENTNVWPDVLADEVS